jgi:tetratricopeptide (TPR) repeat protein
MLSMSIGPNLRRLRVARGLTQQELAHPAYTHAYVSTIEAGRRHPSQAALEHFAAKLETTVDELVTGVPPDLEPRLELELSEARRDLSAGHFDEALEHFERLARRARRHGLRVAEAKAAVGAGTCLERKGQADVAIERYEGALDLLDKEPITSKVDAFSGLARCHSMLGDYRYAAYLLEGTLHGLRDLPDPSALLRIRASLVPLYFDMGLYEKAGREAEEALTLSRSVSDPFRLATMYLNVAQVHLHGGRFTEAQECLEKSEELFSDLELQSEVAMAHLALGYVFLRNRKWHKAREQLETARSHFEATDDRMNRARVLNELARLHRLQGRTDEARATAELVLSLVGDHDVRARALAHRELGMASGDDDPVSAQKNLRAAIDLFEAGDQPSEVAATCRLLGDLLHEQGESEGGCDTYRRGLMALETLV